jgi:hypothetical protein
MTETQKFLEKLNDEYYKLHKKYEDFYWTYHMGDHSVEKAKDKANDARNAFRANANYYAKAKELYKTANKKDKKSLGAWMLFFSKWQTPPELLEIKGKIVKLESKILTKKAQRKEGYVDPKTKKFVKASLNKLVMIMRTNPDEKIRKAAFEARQLLAQDCLNEYVQMVGLYNEYARGMGYSDFYSYKVFNEEGMTKKELFELFDSIYEKTKYAFKDVQEMEKKRPGLRKPWNFSYMLSADFIKEEDQYFQFDQALMRWGQSFAALGIDYKNGELTLDLLDREGKRHNGFCHWPKTVMYQNGKRYIGSANFTTNVVAGQVGSGVVGLDTLFHEGGHAAHLLNCENPEAILNTEYPPTSTAWDETQSMFLDDLSGSVEWRNRYAKNKEGKTYPFDLFERKVKKFSFLTPLDFMGILWMANFEREIYEAKKLTPKKVIEIAKKTAKKYSGKSVDSLDLLNAVHIYSWDSICSYHGYGLAQLALSQWRKYFYDKYGYIVDNPNVGREMRKVWELGSSKTYKEMVVLATGKPISAKAYLESITRSASKTLKVAKERIARLEKVKPFKGKVKLNAKIRLVHGKKEIANNKKSFEDMAQKYAAWLNKQ